jgi:hypothetical protein
LSLNEMAAFVAEEAEQSEPHNGAHTASLAAAAMGSASRPLPITPRLARMKPC